jgi:hypothetical protein
MRRPVLIAFATGMALMALLAGAPGDRQQDAGGFHSRLLPALQPTKTPALVTPTIRSMTSLQRPARPDSRPDRWSISRDRTDRPTRDTLPLAGTHPPQQDQPDTPQH